MSLINNGKDLEEIKFGKFYFQQIESRTIFEDLPKAFSQPDTT